MADPHAPRAMEFASPFDERLFHEGPPALFTLDPSGRLRVDPERTREAYLLVTPTGRDPGHFVLADRATGLRMYVLVSHTALATCQPRADVIAHPDYASAVADTVAQWAAPAPEPVVDEP
jgi:hypothetical protein